MGLPGLVWERGLCGCGDNPGQGLQSKPRAGFAGTTPSSTSEQDKWGLRAEPRAKLARVLGQLCEHPWGKVGSQKRGRGAACFPIPISLASTKGAWGAGGFHTAAGRRRPAWPCGPEPNRAEWQTYGADKAILIGDHCKFPSQMEWKNAIKLI